MNFQPLHGRIVRHLALASLFALGACKIPDPEMAKPFVWQPPDQMPPRLESSVIPTNFNNVTGAGEAGAAERTPTPRPFAEEAAKPTVPEKLYSFSAKDLDIRDALALFAKSHHLNIVSDPEVKGTVTMEFQDLTLPKSMQALLESFGYYAEIDAGLIRVRETRTETFTVDYIRLVRGGNGSSSANVGSSAVSSGIGGGGGGGKEVANVVINQSDSVKFWDELSEQLKPLLSTVGSVAVSRMAGTVMVTDRKNNVERVAQYLGNIKKTLHRQVDIEARIYEVVLRDNFQFGIDWENVTAKAGDYMLSSGGFPTMIPSSDLRVANPIGGKQPGAPALSLQITHEESKAIVDALQEMGNLKIVSQPRIRTMNNQSAMIKVGSDKPFFRTSSTTVGTAGQPVVAENTEVQTVTIGTILSLTPQISEDGWITMDISPVITRLIATASSADGTTAPEVDIKQTSSLVRMRENTTVIIGGLIQDEHTKSTRKVPVLGDIPLLGYLFRGIYESTEKTELVIFITPTIVR